MANTITTKFIEALQDSSPEACQIMLLMDIPNIDFSSSCTAENPLFLTAVPNGMWSRMEILSSILDSDSPNINLNIKNEDGFELFEILLSVYFHIPVNPLSCEGNPINEPSIVSQVLTKLVHHHNFNPNTLLRTGHTPLMYCLMDERLLWLAKELLSLKTVDTAITDKHGYSAYGIAIIFHNKMGLDLLNEHDVEPSNKDKTLLVSRISYYEVQNNAFRAVGRPSSAGYLMQSGKRKYNMIRVVGEEYYEKAYQEELIEKQRRTPIEKPYAFMEEVGFFKYPHSQNTIELDYTLNPFFAEFVFYMETVYMQFDTRLEAHYATERLDGADAFLDLFETRAKRTTFSSEEVQNKIVDLLDQLWMPVWGEENGSSEHITEYIKSSDLIPIYKALAETNDKAKQRLQTVTEEVQKSIDNRIKEGKKPYRIDTELMEYIKA